MQLHRPCTGCDRRPRPCDKARNRRREGAERDLQAERGRRNPEQARRSRVCQRNRARRIRNSINRQRRDRIPAAVPQHGPRPALDTVSSLSPLQP